MTNPVATLGPSRIETGDHLLPPVFIELGPDAGDTVTATFRIVARRGTIGDWAVYFGPDDWTDAQIAADGNKLPVEGARVMFPNIDGPYRD